ncbi:hypothetical protein [Pseudoduganella buxea]|uniref:Uncharacterized protein n=1 Tax=Pseudoduganella buxea TaxID=1949069 RepID=A0A6I3T0S6_9BURK|nr:hypothetical protein [Pseudoduganella buxea]MTV54436.1 hypothetical protein [Pseudoduganella buxea]GGC05477.1 hypothetical protein GCM10011572_29210 [Pseudoduganella buxea]
MRHLLALLASTFMTTTALAAPPLPREVRDFIKHADLCERLAGKWDSSLPPERRRSIERGVDRHCATAQRQHGKLARKYAGNARVRKIIEQHAYDAVRHFDPDPVR